MSRKRAGSGSDAVEEILYRLFVLREPEIMFVANQLNDQRRTFDAALATIDRSPWLLEQVESVRRSNGHFAIHLKPDGVAGEQRGPKAEFTTGFALRGRSRCAILVLSRSRSFGMPEGWSS